MGNRGYPTAYRNGSEDHGTQGAGGYQPGAEAFVAPLALPGVRTPVNPADVFRRGGPSINPKDFGKKIAREVLPKLPKGIPPNVKIGIIVGGAIFTYALSTKRPQFARTPGYKVLIPPGGEGIPGWIHDNHLEYGFPYGAPTVVGIDQWWPEPNGHITGQTIVGMSPIGTAIPDDVHRFTWYSPNPLGFTDTQGKPMHGALTDSFHENFADGADRTALPQIVYQYADLQTRPEYKMPFDAWPYQLRDVNSSAGYTVPPPITEAPPAPPTPEWKLEVTPLAATAPAGQQPPVIVTDAPAPPREPPKRGEKEKKLIANVAGRNIFARVLNGYTELMDVIRPIFMSMPRSAREGWEGGADLAKMLELINKNWDKVDWNKATKKIAENQLEDKLLGRLSGAAAKRYSEAQRATKLNRPVGPETGGGLSGKALGEWWKAQGEKRREARRQKIRDKIEARRDRRRLERWYYYSSARARNPGAHIKNRARFDTKQWGLGLKGKVPKKRG